MLPGYLSDLVRIELILPRRVLGAVPVSSGDGTFWVGFARRVIHGVRDDSMLSVWTNPPGMD
jgi:hypothetical protein